jgi:hypothetical protein
MLSAHGAEKLKQAGCRMGKFHTVVGRKAADDMGEATAGKLNWRKTALFTTKTRRSRRNLVISENQAAES